MLACFFVFKTSYATKTIKVNGVLVDSSLDFVLQLKQQEKVSVVHNIYNLNSALFATRTFKSL
jgi:hypothetical protein